MVRVNENELEQANKMCVENRNRGILQNTWNMELLEALKKRNINSNMFIIPTDQVSLQRNT